MDIKYYFASEHNTPEVLSKILVETDQLGFTMGSDVVTGSLLRALVASKPGGRFLEIGTGTGIATSWLLQGMDQDSILITLEKEDKFASIARKYLGNDPRVTFHLVDAGTWLEQNQHEEFDLIFADSWPGKYSHLNEALSILKLGGIYVIDDMLPQPNWPEGHEASVRWLLNELASRSDLVIAKLACSTGLVLATKVTP